MLISYHAQVKMQVLLRNYYRLTYGISLLSIAEADAMLLLAKPLVLAL